MRIFKDKGFNRFARRQNISDKDLCEAIERADRGLIDAELGGGVIKQRIPRPNEGRAGGFRTIVFFQSGAHSIFVYGFAKNERDNIAPNELLVFKTLAQVVLAYTEEELDSAVNLGVFIEVICNGEDLQK